MEGKQYVIIFMAVEVADGNGDVPKIVQSEKCRGWASCSLLDILDILEVNWKDNTSTVCLFGLLRKLGE